METNGKTIIEKFKEASQVKEKIDSYMRTFLEKKKEEIIARMKEENEWQQ
jgi:predicted transcriptional regulator